MRTACASTRGMELRETAVRKQPLLERKSLFADLLKQGPDGIEYNDYVEGPRPVIVDHACKLGHEGIVAKRRDLAYESGKSWRWLKIKNPDSPQ